MYRPDQVISGVFSVCLKRGHYHCFDIVDPEAAVLRHHLTDPTVEVLTTMGTKEPHIPGFEPMSHLILDQEVVQVKVVDVDDDAVIVEYPDHTTAVIH